MVLTVSELFGNDMVLQREREISVWGTAEKHVKITVDFQGRTAETVSDGEGKWRVKLPPMPASRGGVLTVRDRKETVTFENVAVGEVWLAGGQSNMEFYMRYDKDLKAQLPECENPDIRFFDYPRVPCEKAGERRDYSAFGWWRTCTPENLQWFSAVGYYFARDLQRALGVPVGIVGCNCGGTRSCCWMDEETIRECGPEWLEDYEKGVAEIGDLAAAEEQYLSLAFTDNSNPFENAILDKFMYGIPQEEMAAGLAGMEENMLVGNRIGPWHEWRPAGLYRRMVEHICPFTLRGVIWYQGESDETHPDRYADMMCGLIGLWRRRWGAEMPFIMAQLAPYETGGQAYPALRERQVEVTERMEQVWLVPTGDVGSDYDIHPKEKQPIGVRMALSARGHVYGEKLLCDAPVCAGASRDGNSAVIRFGNAAGGLTVKGNRVQALEVLAGDSAVPPESWTAEAEGDALRIRFRDGIPAEKVTVRFAKTPYFEVNLYNAAGIPAFPFAAEV